MFLKGTHVNQTFDFVLKCYQKVLLEDKTKYLMIFFKIESGQMLIELFGSKKMLFCFLLW